MQLAFDALEEGQSMLPFMNACNDVLVKRFLEKEISWLDISKRLEKLMSEHQKAPIHSLEDVLYYDRLAKRLAKSG